MNYIEELTEIMNDNPELIFDNDGYETLSQEIQNEKAEVITQIETILKENIEEFVSFQNFKPRKDGSFAIRMQVHYDASFVGVHYMPMI